MSKIQLEKDTIISIYKTSNLENKKMLEKELTKKFFENIIDKIKDFDDILELSGYESEEEFLPYKKPKNKKEIKLNNIARLQLISEVYNEGWVEDWNNNQQYKYYPYFNKSSYSWVVYGCDYYCGSSSVGSLVYFKDKEKALDAGNKFIKIYSEILG